MRTHGAAQWRDDRRRAEFRMDRAEQGRREEWSGMNNLGVTARRTKSKCRRRRDKNMGKWKMEKDRLNRRRKWRVLSENADVFYA